MSGDVAGALLVASSSVAVALTGVGAALACARRRRKLLGQLDRLEAAVVDLLSADGGIGVPAGDGSDHVDHLPVLAEVPGPLEVMERRLRLVAAVLSARRQRVDLLERAVRSVPEGLVVTDEQGDVVFRNDVATDYVGARHSDALVEAAVHDLVTAAAREGRDGSRTLELFGPPRRTMVVTARPVLAGGRPVGGLALIGDITEMRRLEAIRRDFVANISHELKTPVGALSLLAETIGTEDDLAVIQRLAERMVTEAGRLASTIEDLLLLSRIESEEGPGHEDVAVGRIVAEAVNRIRPAAENAAISLDVPEAAGSVSVRGDRRQLVSALYNLLDNAVKYSDPGSEVAVEVAVAGGEVQLAVEDHGIGIPARDLERVFERFYRVDLARSRRTGGTGLGLAIVRHVMANHDGRVTVESRLGEGSTFVLRIPLAAPAAPGGRRPGPVPSPAASPTGLDLTRPDR